jgi:hypothetical protein
MRTSGVLYVCGLALLLPPMLGAAEDAKKPLTVELRSFKFQESSPELFGYNEGDEKLFFYTNGTAEAKVKVPAEGDYEIVVKASSDKALGEGAKFQLAVDGKEIGKETEAATEEPKEYKFTTPMKAGEHKLSIKFTNDVYKEGEYDRNLYVHAVTLRKVK